MVSVAVTLSTDVSPLVQVTRRLKIRGRTPVVGAPFGYTDAVTVVLVPRSRLKGVLIEMEPALLLSSTTA
ncbi:MAG TPA: hypothetical protein VGB96_17445, partial [Archangium sp.]